MTKQGRIEIFRTVDVSTHFLEEAYETKEEWEEFCRGLLGNNDKAKEALIDNLDEVSIAAQIRESPGVMVMLHTGDEERCDCCGDKATHWVYDEERRKSPLCSDCVTEGIAEGFFDEDDVEEM